jgi:hypothetical protein
LWDGLGDHDPFYSPGYDSGRTACLALTELQITGEAQVQAQAGTEPGMGAGGRRKEEYLACLLNNSKIQSKEPGERNTISAAARLMRMAIELSEDECRLIIQALRHYDAYLHATNRRDGQARELAERLQGQKSAHRKRDDGTAAGKEGHRLRMERRKAR